MRRFTIGEDRTGESLTIETDDIKLVEAVSRILSGGTAITSARELDDWSDEILENYCELMSDDSIEELPAHTFADYCEPEKFCNTFTIEEVKPDHTLYLTEYEKNVVWRTLHDYQQEHITKDAPRWKDLEAIKERLQSK